MFIIIVLFGKRGAARGQLAAKSGGKCCHLPHKNCHDTSDSTTTTTEQGATQQQQTPEEEQNSIAGIIKLLAQDNELKQTEIAKSLKVL